MAEYLIEMEYEVKYPSYIKVITDFYECGIKFSILKYKKLLQSSRKYIILGIKPGRKLPPKRD